MTDLEYRMTFGCQYGPGSRRTTHPVWPQADADGWVTILAPDESAACECALWLFGREWSNLYPADLYSDDIQFYPLGELARVHHTATKLSQVIVTKAVSG